LDSAKKRYAAQVVGCRVNQYELQSMRAQLEAHGYTAAEEGETAELCVVNTCAVTESAESSSRHAVRSLLSRNPHAKILVTGCLAQKDPSSLQEISESVHVLPNTEKDRFFESLFPSDVPPSPFITTFEGHTRAFIKIQDGCTCFCSYCIVPYLRGTSRSRKKEDILEEIRGLVAASYKEIVVTGVNVGDFPRLVDLLQAIDAIDGIKRLRLSSINPNDIDEEFIEVVPQLKSFCPALHLVLQSGSNSVLKKMRRKYTREMYLDLVERFRKKQPDFAFSTDVIVGFPGETDADLEQTAEVIKAVNFSKVHLFPYSVREGTLAARFQDVVPVETIKERKAKIAQIAQECACMVRQQFVGKRVTVLTEEEGGQTPHGLVVKLNEPLPKNHLVDVKVVGFDEELIGELI
jgi:threonylcarbamoyladenosine tRNA methylthiotransferase MtaB